MKDKALTNPRITAAQIAELSIITTNISAALDDRNYSVWLGAFTPDAPYGAITAANADVEGPHLFMDFGVDGRKERIAFWLGMWQVGRGRTRHVVGLAREIAGEEGSVRTASSFIITRTGDDGTTKLYASGIYDDRWVESDGGWKIAARIVRIDCEVLPASFTDPL